MQYEYGERIPGTDVFAQVTRCNPSPHHGVDEPHAGHWAFALTVRVPDGLVLYKTADYGALEDYPLRHTQIAKIAFILLDMQD